MTSDLKENYYNSGEKKKKKQNEAWRDKQIKIT